LGDVEHEARLPHRRPGRDDHQIAALQAARHLVEIDKARRHAGDQPLLLEQLLDLRKAFLHQIAHRHEAGLQTVVGNGEDRRLGFVKDDVGFLIGLVGVGEDLVGGVDQIAESALLLDDLRVVLDVGRTRDAIGERGDIGRTADVIELPRPGELLFQRDEVDRIVALIERHHLVEDAAVRVAIEIVAIDHLRGEVERVVVDQDRAED
jgi:hypothetical protein